MIGPLHGLANKVRDKHDSETFSVSTLKNPNRVHKSGQSIALVAAVPSGNRRTKPSTDTPMIASRKVGAS